MHMNGLCTCLVSRLVFCCVPERIWIEISNIHRDGIKENVGGAKKERTYDVLHCSLQWVSHSRWYTVSLDDHHDGDGDDYHERNIHVDDYDI